MNQKTNFKEAKFRLYLNLNVGLGIILIACLVGERLGLFIREREFFLIVVVLAATSTVILGALRSLIRKKISVELLASIALLASLAEREWASVIFINLMIVSARVFVNYVEIKSHSAIGSLLKMKPKKAKVERGGKIVEVSVEKIKKGEKIIAELGDMIPVDGVIEKGEASVDQSSLTGESIPVFKKAGDMVLSSTVVVSGNLTIIAQKIGEETTFEKIIDLVEQSQKNKAGIQTLGDKFSQWYIALTLLGSLVIYLISKDVNLVLAVLLVSCADDIAVATPMAVMAAITHAVKHGAVVKGGSYLEGLSKVKVIVVDKTGTLTRGKLKVEEVFASGGKKADDIIALAATATLFSHHPVAQAIVSFAKEKKISVRKPEKYEEHRGEGITATCGKNKIAIGKPSFFEEMKIYPDARMLSQIEKEKAKGFNITLISQGRKVVGLIALADKPRPKLKETIREFRDLGVERIVMLTGDNEKIAKKIADEVGISEFHANLLPEDKLKYIKKLLSKKYKTAMIGDGVNDAPALVLSDIGIAMGAIGSDVAIESADIALMKDDISQVPELMKISNATVKLIKNNFYMWGLINVLGFFLVFARFIGPSGAAAYNFITDFIPIVNSLRLFKKT